MTTIVARIQFDLIRSKVSIKMDRLISITILIELFKLILKNELLRSNARVFVSTE